MDIRIREYTEADAEEAVRIWNHIVEEGAAFPQLELLTAEIGNRFFQSSHLQGLHMTVGEEKSWDCIFSIPIMWGAAAISAMPATRLNPSCGDIISERHW